MLAQKLFSLLAIILPIHWLAPIKSDRRLGKYKISFQVFLMTPPCADLLAPCLPGIPTAASWPRAHLWLQWHRRVPEPSCRGSWGRGGELRLLQGRREGWVWSWGIVLQLQEISLHQSCCKDLEWFFSVSQETILIIWDRGAQWLSPDCPSRGCSFWLGNPLISVETPGTC